MAERLAGMFHRRYAEADDEYQRALAVLLQQPLAEFGMEKSLLEAVEVLEFLLEEAVLEACFIAPVENFL